jgi:acyl-CoA synthetase (AMP-forming)/AMP-acid ligase II
VGPGDTRATAWTWGELIAAAATLADAFAAAGLAPGDRVAHVGPHAPDWILVDFACLLAGVVHVPLHADAARSEQLAFEHADIGHGFFTKAIVDTLRLDRSLLVEQLKRKERTVSMVGLASAVQELVPYYTGHRQSPVCRMVGDLLPLVIFKR